MRRAGRKPAFLGRDIGSESGHRAGCTMPVRQSSTLRNDGA